MGCVRVLRDDESRVDILACGRDEVDTDGRIIVTSLFCVSILL